MIDNSDYTKLPIGHLLSDGRKIEKCPKCGRNGALLNLGNSEYYEHFGMKEFSTATGELHAKRIRKNSKCLFKKAITKNA